MQLVVDGDEREAGQRGLVEHERLRVRLARECEYISHAVERAERIARLLARQHAVAAVARGGERLLDLRVALPVAHHHELRVGALRRDKLKRVDEQRYPLLRSDPPRVEHQRAFATLDGRRAGR